MIERDELARRLEPVLSETPEYARDLMARAGLGTNRKIAGVVTVALLQLKREGKARSHGTQPNIKWTRVDDSDKRTERLPLAHLDATVILTTTTRTTAGGTRRTELAAVVELGPSWPAGTHPPPRWSTAFSDAQLATGALAGARSNAIARAEAQLRALRAGKTLAPLPTEDRMTRPNPLLLPSKNRDDFFAYLASIDRGARQDSACAWLAKRAIAQTTDEALAWLDELVVRRLLDERVGVAPDGTTVVRYLPVEPTTPAPLPKSSAPAEEVPSGKPLPAPKVTPKKAPALPRPAPVADEDTGDPTDDEGALDDPAEHDSDDPPEVEESGEVARLTRERDDARAQVLELDRGWDAHRAELAGGLEAPPDSSWSSLLTKAHSAHKAALSLTREVAELKAEADLYYEALCRIVPDLRGTSAKHLAEGACQQAMNLGQEVKFAQAFTSELARALALPSGLERRDLLAHVVALVDEARAARREAKHPTTYQGDPAEQFATSIAGWLVGLSDETWLEVTRARHQLAKARDLREQSHSLEHSALEALDRAVGARPAAPPAPVAAPAPEPEPAVEATAQPTPEPPASGEQANDKLSWHHMAINPATGERTGTTRDRVLTVYLEAGAEVSAQDVARRLGLTTRELSGPLSKLTSEGKLERPARGVYRLARKGRRAA